MTKTKQKKSKLVN